MIMETFMSLTYLAATTAIYLFWGRGIIQSRKDDLILSVVLLVLISLGTLVFIGHSGVFSQIGFLHILFGLETLLVSIIAKPDCPITRGGRVRIGVYAIIIGLLSSTIL